MCSWVQALGTIVKAYFWREGLKHLPWLIDVVRLRLSVTQTLLDGHVHAKPVCCMILRYNVRNMFAFCSIDGPKLQCSTREINLPSNTIVMMLQILTPPTEPRSKRVTFAGGFLHWQDPGGLRSEVCTSGYRASDRRMI